MILRLHNFTSINTNSNIMSELNLILNGINLEQLAKDVNEIKNFILDIKQVEIQDEILSFDEGCKKLGISRVTGWKWAKQGKIKTYKIGNKVMMMRSEIMTTISNNVTKK